jgi:hypothetical protein
MSGPPNQGPANLDGLDGPAGMPQQRGPMQLDDVYSLYGSMLQGYNKPGNPVLGGLAKFVLGDDLGLSGGMPADAHQRVAGQLMTSGRFSPFEVAQAGLAHGAPVGYQDLARLQTSQTGQDKFQAEYDPMMLYKQSMGKGDRPIITREGIDGRSYDYTMLPNGQYVPIGPTGMGGGEGGPTGWGRGYDEQAAAGMNAKERDAFMTQIGERMPVIQRQLPRVAQIKSLINDLSKVGGDGAKMDVERLYDKYKEYLPMNLPADFKDMSNEQAVREMQSAINAMALDMKPTGMGNMTEAEWPFLFDQLANPNNRPETNAAIMDKLELLLKHEQEYLTAKREAMAKAIPGYQFDKWYQANIYPKLATKIRSGLGDAEKK